MSPRTINFARNSLMRHKLKMPSISTTRSMSTSSHNSAPSYPRAAVSVVIRFHEGSTSTSTSTNEPVRYLLIQRGKAPNKGMWSLPGGKIENNEGIMDAAKRELREETGLGDNSNQQWTLKWHNDGPFTCSDSITGGFHYVIRWGLVISMHWSRLILSLTNTVQSMLCWGCCIIAAHHRSIRWRHRCEMVEQKRGWRRRAGRHGQSWRLAGVKAFRATIWKRSTSVMWRSGK